MCVLIEVEFFIDFSGNRLIIEQINEIDWQACLKSIILVDWDKVTSQILETESYH